MTDQKRKSRHPLALLGVTTCFGWAALVAAPSASAQTAQDCFLGEITMFAGNFAPRGWAFANGQQVLVDDNPALFSIIGTIYGGDGRTTFALPDLRGRTAVHPSVGTALTDRRLGAQFGVEEVSLTTAEMPRHKHRLRASDGSANSTIPNNRVLASPNRRIYDDSANVGMDRSAIANTGQGESHENVPPSLAINHIICISGQFPSRN